MLQAPLAHPGGAGLLWAIQGGRLVELHRDWAVIELAANGSRHVFERRRVDAGNVTLLALAIGETACFTRLEALGSTTPIHRGHLCGSSGRRASTSHSFQLDRRGRAPRPPSPTHRRPTAPMAPVFERLQQFLDRG